jgi:hypothetical protein
LQSSLLIRFARSPAKQKHDSYRLARNQRVSSSLSLLRNPLWVSHPPCLCERHFRLLEFVPAEQTRGGQTKVRIGSLIQLAAADRSKQIPPILKYRALCHLAYTTAHRHSSKKSSSGSSNRNDCCVGDPLHPVLCCVDRPLSYKLIERTRRTPQSAFV